MPDEPTPRQLIVLCDGTNNNITGGYNDTNVVKLAELLARQPHPQRLIHYDPGVGNPGEMPGATVIDQSRRRLERIAGLAFGRGVYENIAEAYLFLMRTWRSPEDRIFVFGFSRGAFTARAVAGLINRFGLLHPDLEVMVPTLLHLYFADRDSRNPAKRRQWEAITAQVQRLFAGGPRIGADGQPNPHSRRAFVHFVGLWDTVASVGMWPFGLKITMRPRVEHKYFVHMRQALALDEQRAQFKQRLMLGDNSDHIPIAEGRVGTLRQLWFRGAHCDVGGYYAPGETALSDHTMAWLVSEAVSVGLWLDVSAGAGREGDVAAIATAPDAAGSEAGTTPSTGPEKAVLAALQEAGLTTADQRPVLHNENFSTPLWALAGLAVRETCFVVLDNGMRDPITPVAHPSVAAFDAHPRAGHVWTRKRPKRSLAWMMLACLLLPLYLGWVLDPCIGAESPAATFGCLLGNNWRFQMWQFDGATLLFSGTDWSAWAAQLARFASPRWALVWDLLLIAAYAYVLAFAVTWAFARVAGLRPVACTEPGMLNRLGWALPLMVAADLVENLLGFAAISATDEPLLLIRGFGALLAMAAALASVIKFVGLAGVLVLLGWGAAAGAPRIGTTRDSLRRGPAGSGADGP